MSLQYGVITKRIGMVLTGTALRQGRVFFALTLSLATLLVAGAEKAAAQEFPRIEVDTLGGLLAVGLSEFDKSVRGQLDRIEGAKYVCKSPAAVRAIDWLGWETNYVGNLIGGDDPTKKTKIEGLESDLRAELAKLEALPPCKTNIQTEFDKRLMERLRTGARPGEGEERLEIGMGRVWTGFNFGVETLENFGRVRTTETLGGVVTNQFSESGDPLGVGIVAGYNFAPWNNNIVVGGFFSFDWLKQTINHTFPGGTFLGTTTHWIATAGAKAGVAAAPGVLLYGLAGASWLNHDLNINFATAASQNTTTPGFTAGFGGEFKPSVLQSFGAPVTVFVQYQHTWWSTANFNAPASSPAFNYAFKREDDTIKLGVNVYLSPPPTPPARRIISK